MKFVLYGTPISKDRPRFFSTKKGIRSFDPRKADKLLCQREIKNQIEIIKSTGTENQCCEAIDLLNFDYFHVSLSFHMPIPLSDSRAKKQAKLEGSLKHTVKPDIDNLEKFVLDFLNGIVFQDDKQVISLKSEKLYSDTPKTEIKIEGFFYETK